MKISKYDLTYCYNIWTNILASQLERPKFFTHSSKADLYVWKNDYNHFNIKI